MVSDADLLPAYQKLNELGCIDITEIMNFNKPEFEQAIDLVT
jgi:hypothetical protein